MLTKLEAFILGIIQGLTEFLPISSTGHLYLGRNLFGLQEAGLLLDTMLHVGTLLAVFVFYKDEFIKIIKTPFSKSTFLLIVGTIPAVIFGLAFKDYIDEISKTGVTIGWEFLLTGLFLWLADSAKNGHKKMEDISYKDAFIIGTFQAVAIMPAISRSGMTIVAALWRNGSLLFIPLVNTSDCRGDCPANKGFARGPRGGNLFICLACRHCRFCRLRLYCGKMDDWLPEESFAEAVCHLCLGTRITRVIFSIYGSVLTVFGQAGRFRK